MLALISLPPRSRPSISSWGCAPPAARGEALHSPDFNPDEAALPNGLTAAAGLLAALSEPED